MTEITEREIGGSLSHLKQASASLELAQHYLSSDPDLQKRIYKLHCHLRDEVAHLLKARKVLVDHPNRKIM